MPVALTRDVEDIIIGMRLTSDVLVGTCGACGIPLRATGQTSS
jgi:hypothetical protein